MEELAHRELGLTATQTCIAAKELPGVDVAHRHELGQPALPLQPAAAGEGRREDAGAPGAVNRSALIDDRFQRWNPLLFGQHLEAAISDDLVVVDKNANRAGWVARHCLVALPANLLRLALNRCGEEAVPAAEAANHGLHGDSGATGDLIQRDLIRRQLPEDLDSRVEDALRGRRGGLGPGNHAIGATQKSFDISYINMKCG